MYKINFYTLKISLQNKVHNEDKFIIIIVVVCALLIPLRFVCTDTFVCTLFKSEKKIINYIDQLNINTKNHV